MSLLNSEYPSPKTCPVGNQYFICPTWNLANFDEVVNMVEQDSGAYITSTGTAARAELEGILTAADELYLIARWRSNSNAESEIKLSNTFIPGNQTGVTWRNTSTLRKPQFNFNGSGGSSGSFLSSSPKFPALTPYIIEVAIRVAATPLTTIEFWLYEDDGTLWHNESMSWNGIPNHKDLWIYVPTDHADYRMTDLYIQSPAALGSDCAGPYPTKHAILPDAAGKITHSRILRAYRNDVGAKQFHNIMKAKTT